MYINPTITPRTTSPPGNEGPSTEGIERIAIVRHRLRHEPVVDGIPADVLGNHTIDGTRVRAHVELPFAAVAARYLDVGVDSPVVVHWRRVAPDVPRVAGRRVKAGRQLRRAGCRQHVERRLMALGRQPTWQNDDRDEMANPHVMLPL